MLNSYFKSPSTIARYRAGLAGPYLDRFIPWLEDLGYQRVSIRRHVREVVHFASWATSEGLHETELDSDSLVSLCNHLTELGVIALKVRSLFLLVLEIRGLTLIYDRVKIVLAFDIILP